MISPVSASGSTPGSLLSSLVSQDDGVPQGHFTVDKVNTVASEVTFSSYRPPPCSETNEMSSTEGDAMPVQDPTFKRPELDDMALFVDQKKQKIFQQFEEWKQNFHPVPHPYIWLRRSIAQNVVIGALRFLGSLPPWADTQEIANNMMKSFSENLQNAVSIEELRIVLRNIIPKMRSQLVFVDEPTRAKIQKAIELASFELCALEDNIV